jgi:para-aminobenzoate synthetase component 1
MILKLLPAGSISGTPKKKTIKIIKEVEGYKRGFYTGIFGITDEKTFLDSAVIIRYIEKDKDNLIYKSGGGITIDSNLESEYKELIDKVYIPV